MCQLSNQASRRLRKQFPEVISQNLYFSGDTWKRSRQRRQSPPRHGATMVALRDRKPRKLDGSVRNWQSNIMIRRSSARCWKPTQTQCPSVAHYGSLRTLRTSLTPGVCTQDCEIRTETPAGRRRSMGKMTPLANSFSSSTVRRSSSSLISSGNPRHLAVPAQLAGLTFLKTAHIIGSWSGQTTSVGQSQNLQGAGNMQVVWLQLDSPLKKSSPCIKMWVCKPLWKKWHGEAARREIIFPPPRPGHNVLSTIKQHPWVRTSSFAVFHIHLALLPLAPWPAIGHTRRVPHQRGSGSTHICNGDLEGVLNAKNVFVTRNTG